MNEVSESPRVLVDDRTAPGRNGDGSLRERVRSLRLQGRGDPRAGGPTAVLPWGVAGVFLLTTLAVGYYAYRVAPRDRPVDAGPVAEPPRSSTPGVPVVAPGAVKAGAVVAESKGNIVPRRHIQLSPEVSGVIVELNVEEGMQVKAGDVLARLKTDEYQAEVNRCAANLEAAERRRDELKTGRPEEIKQAKKDLEETRANLESARLDLARLRKLGIGATSQRELEQAQSTYDALFNRSGRLAVAVEMLEVGARPERKQAAEAEIKAAQAELKKAQLKLSYCEVKAPITGTILVKKAEKYSSINPSSFGQGGSLSASLCDIADLSDIEVEVFLQERELPKVKPNQPCTIMPMAYSGDPEFRKVHPEGYRGWVSRLMPIADRSRGAVVVRVKVAVPAAEQGRFLKPEMAVDVSFLAGKLSADERAAIEAEMKHTPEPK